MFQTIRSEFHAAHYIPGHEKCGCLHGHTWRVEVCVQVPFKMSRYKDFSDLKAMIDEVLPDHKNLNEFYSGMDPTCENLAQKIFSQLQKRMAVCRLTLWETDKYGVVVEG